MLETELINCSVSELEIYLNSCLEEKKAIEASEQKKIENKKKEDLISKILAVKKEIQAIKEGSVPSETTPSETTPSEPIIDSASEYLVTIDKTSEHLKDIKLRATKYKATLISSTISSIGKVKIPKDKYLTAGFLEYTIPYDTKLQRAELEVLMQVPRNFYKSWCQNYNAPKQGTKLSEFKSFTRTLFEGQTGTKVPVNTSSVFLHTEHLKQLLGNVINNGFPVSNDVVTQFTGRIVGAIPSKDEQYLAKIAGAPIKSVAVNSSSILVTTFDLKAYVESQVVINKVTDLDKLKPYLYIAPHSFFKFIYESLIVNATFKDSYKKFIFGYDIANSKNGAADSDYLLPHCDKLLCAFDPTIKLYFEQNDWKTGTLKIIPWLLEYRPEVLDFAYRMGAKHGSNGYLKFLRRMSTYDAATGNLIYPSVNSYGIIEEHPTLILSKEAEDQPTRSPNFINEAVWLKDHKKDSSNQIDTIAPVSIFIEQSQQVDSTPSEVVAPYIVNGYDISKDTFDYSVKGYNPESIYAPITVFSKILKEKNGILLLPKDLNRILYDSGYHSPNGQGGWVVTEKGKALSDHYEDKPISRLKQDVNGLKHYSYNAWVKKDMYPIILELIKNL